MKHLPLLIGVSVLAIGAAAGDCPQFYPGRKVGDIQSPLITEASGLAASRKNRGILWTHNDHGNAADVYAMAADGTLLGIFRLRGAKSRDWEDIAIGPGPDPNTDYLYVGDIGDNNARYKSATVYRIPEPAVDPNNANKLILLEGVEAIELVYPDGPRNAETLMLDPVTKDIYIVSKESATKVYRAPWPQSTTEIMTLEKVADIGLGTATAGDISAGGDMIIVRGYFSALLWMRPSSSSLPDAFKGPQCSVPLILETQGEAICFDANATGYYTTSEKKHQPIYYFQRKP